MGLKDLPSPGDSESNTRPSLSALSCFACRRKKIRCDKNEPCERCQRSQVVCIMPVGRKPRQPNRQRENAPAQLFARLGRLESKLQLIRQPEHVSSIDHVGRAAFPVDSVGQADQSSTPSPSTPDRVTSLEISEPNTPGNNHDFEALPSGECDFASLERNKLDYESRLQAALMDSMIGGTKLHVSPSLDSAGPEVDCGAFVLGYASSTDLDTQTLHPMPSQLLFYWDRFVENVDPLLKILHVPSMTLQLQNFAKGVAEISPHMEALLFAIFFATVVSLDEHETQWYFAERKTALILRFRRGVEMALIKAKFLVTSNLATIQALTIFLMALRCTDQTHISWALTTILIHVSRSAGLDREGSLSNNLTPFDLEMRRRLWWSICALDAQVAEEQKVERQILQHSFETKFPANINDSDICGDLDEFPSVRSGFTEMTFSLIRYEICKIMRQLSPNPVPLCSRARRSEVTVAAKNDMLEEAYNHLENQYSVVLSSPDEVLQWALLVILKSLKARIELMVLVSDPSKDAQTRRDDLFVLCFKIIEYDTLLSTDSRCKKYRWLFSTHVEWKAIAFLLMEISRRFWSDKSEEAWYAVNQLLSDIVPNGDFIGLSHRGVTLGSIQLLMARARKQREKELARLAAQSRERKDPHQGIVESSTLDVSNQASGMGAWQQTVCNSGHNRKVNKSDASSAFAEHISQAQDQQNHATGFCLSINDTDILGDNTDSTTLNRGTIDASVPGAEAEQSVLAGLDITTSSLFDSDWLHDGPMLDSFGWL